MAEIFHGSMTANNNTGNWLALPALPAGANPRRRIILRSDAIVEFGHCTAGQSTVDGGTFCTAGPVTNLNFARDSGIVDYNKITVRANGASTSVLYVYSLSSTDDGPRGM